MTVFRVYPVCCGSTLPTPPPTKHSACLPPPPPYFQQSAHAAHCTHSQSSWIPFHSQFISNKTLNDFKYLYYFLIRKKNALLSFEWNKRSGKSTFWNKFFCSICKCTLAPFRGRWIDVGHGKIESYRIQNEQLKWNCLNFKNLLFS